LKEFVDFYNKYLKNHTKEDFLLVVNVKTKSVLVVYTIMLSRTVMQVDFYNKYLENHP